MAPSSAGRSIGDERASSAAEVVLDACGASTVDAPGSTGRGPLVVVAERSADLDVDAVLGALHAGRRVLVAAAPGTDVVMGDHHVSVAPRPLEVSSDRNPLVADPQIDATMTTGPFTAATLTTRDLAAVDGGTALAVAGDGVVVATETAVGAGTLIVVGSSHLLDDQYLAALLAHLDD